MQTRVFLFLLSLMVAFQPTEFGHASTCSDFFVSNPKEIKTFNERYKENILHEAFLHARIEAPKDQKLISKVIKHWDLNNSTPANLEAIAQVLVLNLNNKRTFTQWVRDVVIKGNVVREAVRTRAYTLILTRELLDAVEIRGFLKKNSRLDNFRGLLGQHFNKVQLAKMLVFNSATFYLVGLPLYFPSFNLTKSLDLTTKDLDFITVKGFDVAYPTILKNYKKELRVQQMIEHAPQVFFLSLATYTAFNYLKFETEETRYEIPVEEAIPQSHKLFLEWKKDYEETTGRRADLNNAQDRMEWDTMVQSIYRAWADIFNAKKGRYPDLSKPEDREAWEQFLASLKT